MKLGVRITPLSEAQLIARAAELAARHSTARPARTATSTEVSNGERELGPATGDLRQPDER